MIPLKYWTIDGFEISSYKYSLSSRINKSFNISGSDDSEQCKYTYNELGFRGDSINKEGFKVMSIGCSHTEGIGVNDNETWSAQFCNLISNGVNHNFGLSGRSNDYVSRCLLTYYDLIKPDLVLIMYPSAQRREIYTEDGGVEPFMPTSSWGYLGETDQGIKIQQLKTELQNENEDFINWYKNHTLISLFLESKQCNWIWNGSFLNIQYIDKNRYDGDYGDYKNFIDKGVDKIHAGPKHNKNYSINLFNHLYKNFRNYLPIDSVSIQTGLI